jgi:hypothetical protein
MRGASPAPARRRPARRAGARCRPPATRSSRAGRSPARTRPRSPALPTSSPTHASIWPTSVSSIQSSSLFADVSCRPGTRGAPSRSHLTNEPSPRTGPYQRSGAPDDTGGNTPQIINDRGQTAIPTPPSSQARTTIPSGPDTVRGGVRQARSGRGRLGFGARDCRCGRAASVRRRLIASHLAPASVVQQHSVL